MNALSARSSIRVRPPAHAGRFYPADPALLRTQVAGFLAAAPLREGVPPKALIAPHAGYPYSGPIAGAAYAQLVPVRARVQRVVLVGPSHFQDFQGVAASGADAFGTPLGNVPIDRAWVDRAACLPGVSVADGPHQAEHSLEVHLPFLQMTLAEFQVVPLLVGQATEAEMGRILEALWGGPETCVVVSSDLSHYHDYDTARQLDRVTAHTIESLQGGALDGHDACGFEGVRGLLQVARDHDLVCQTIDLRNSGDTAGSRARVVGYGAFVVAARTA